MNDIILLSDCIELPNHDLMQVIGVRRDLVLDRERLDKIADELNTCCCEGVEIYFVYNNHEDNLDYVFVKENYVLANVVFMWG